MNYLQSAQALYEQMVRDRRHLHQHPEVGMDLPETCSYVMARLTEMGYQPRRLGGGVTATLTGKPDGKVFLLRADMDALPIPEDSGEEFSSEVPGKMRGCGHDMHPGPGSRAQRHCQVHVPARRGGPVRGQIHD